jgi:hypothetical protein
LRVNHYEVVGCSVVIETKSVHIEVLKVEYLIPRSETTVAHYMDLARSLAIHTLIGIVDVTIGSKT